MAFISLSCIKEDRSECYKPILLEFKAIVNVDGEDKEVGAEHIKELMIYVFDEQEEFLKVHKAEIGSALSLSYPNHKKLHLVCWGNSANEQQIVPNLKIGDKIDDALISLITDGTSVEQEKVAIHPNNLFHSTKEVIIGEDKSSTIEMIMRHKVASVNITVKGLTASLSRADDDFSYVLRSGKKQVDFKGNTTGNDVHHTQAAEFKNNIHESGIFNILPSTDNNSNIEIDIYKGSESVFTISTDSNGNPIKVEEGKLLNIHADFSGNNGTISVSVAITSWGEKEIWKEIQ